MILEDRLYIVIFVGQALCSAVALCTAIVKPPEESLAGRDPQRAVAT